MLSHMLSADLDAECTSCWKLTNSHCYRLLTYFLRRLMLMTTMLFTCRAKLFTQVNFHCTLFMMTGYNQLEGSRSAPNLQITKETSYAAFLRLIIMQLARSATHLTTLPNYSIHRYIQIPLIVGLIYLLIESLPPLSQGDVGRPFFAMAAQSRTEIIKA